MIRKISASDRETFLAFSRAFYASDAVLHPVPEAYHEATFDEMMRSEDYAIGYLFEQDGKPVGYALLAKTFSQEAGGFVLWIEELYILPEYRSMGLGRAFLNMLRNDPGPGVKRLRLEVEAENWRALRLYKALGFSPLAYQQYIVEF